jgi:hypothetical protein
MVTIPSDARTMQAYRKRSNLQRIERGQPIASRLRFAPICAPRCATVDIRTDYDRAGLIGRELPGGRALVSDVSQDRYPSCRPWDSCLLRLVQNALVCGRTERQRGQGSIGRVQGSQFWYIWYYTNSGQQVRESTRSTLKQVAQEMLNQRLAAMGRGERSPMEVKSIRHEDMRSILLNDYKRKGIATEKLILVDDKPTGLRGTGIKFLDDFFKGMWLQQIDTDVLQSYRDSRTKEGTGETTVNRDIALLRRMMVLTVRQKKLQFTMPYFPMTSEAGNERTAFVTPVKFRELLDFMPENLRPATLFFFETGCRQGARKKIIWAWVKLDEGIIDIPAGVTKNDKPIILPLSDELVRMLSKQFRKADDPVFDTANMRKAFQAACVKVGLGA